MKIIPTARKLGNENRRVCLAIGVFDGVHLGHQQIIRQTIADARQHDCLSVVLTFDRHPNATVAPDRVPPLIYSQPQKLRAVELLGADAVLIQRFDRAFSRQTGEDFIRILARDLSGGEPRLCGPQPVESAGLAAGRRSAGQRCIQSICVGADFVFGYKRSGNVALLRKLGQELNFTVHGVAAVSLDGQVVSSTRIREAIRVGDFDAASQMLGRAYALAANVIEGDKLGHKLGFPTANLNATGFVLPPNGVYAAHATVRGETHRAVLNIGQRPTVTRPRPQLRVEVHLLDFTGELYGDEISVTFLARLRDERKFASLEELKAQIARDIAETRNAF